MAASDMSGTDKRWLELMLDEVQDLEQALTSMLLNADPAEVKAFRRRVAKDVGAVAATCFMAVQAGTIDAKVCEIAAEAKKGELGG